jgi:hypothetical protein
MAHSIDVTRSAKPGGAFWVSALGQVLYAQGQDYQDGRSTTSQ